MCLPVYFQFYVVNAICSPVLLGIIFVLWSNFLHPGLVIVSCLSDTIAGSAIERERERLEVASCLYHCALHIVAE